MKSTKGFSGIGGGFALLLFLIFCLCSPAIWDSPQMGFTTKTLIGAAGVGLGALGRQRRACSSPGVISFLALGIPFFCNRPRSCLASSPSAKAFGTWMAKRRARLVTLPSRVAPGKFSCGLGVRAVRAGSIGRDGQRLGERDEYPPEGAGGLGPRPLHGEITAS